MLNKLKQEAMRRGMKLMMDPRVMKMMADPRLMNAISQGYAIKGRIQSEIDARLRSVASMFKLATKDELQSVQRNLRQVESTVSTLEKQVKKDG